MTWGNLSGNRGIYTALMVTFAFVLGSLAGCGSSEPVRIPGSGHVTRDGKDVSNYSLSFLPDQSVKGSAAATTVMDGAYEFTSKTGPNAPGAYHVMIQEPAIRIPKNERMNGNAKDPPPARRWEFDYTIPDNGPFTKDFELD